LSIYQSTERMQNLGRDLIGAILRECEPQGLGADALGLTLVVYRDGASPEGFAHNGTRPFYPCSVVKMFWMAACLARIEEGAVRPHAELDRALNDMIAWSSNTATNYVIDQVTGTTGDTLLEGDELAAWIAARSWANEWVRSLRIAEFQGINVCQKNMDDDRYGRERQLVDALGHNSLTTEATARLLHEIFDGRTFSAASRDRMQRLLARRHDPEWVEAHPAAQVRGYLGARLPAEAKLWSKAGWTGWTGDARASYRRHDAARIEAPGLPPFTLVLCTEGKRMSECETALPDIATRALEIVRNKIS
jgi:beta-lactamase class A